MNDYLVVVLDDLRPTLILSSDEKDVFQIRNREFRDTGARSIVGFYDWLRTDERKVVGVRLTIFDEEFDYLTSEIAHLNYVKRLSDSVGFEIYFTDKTQYNIDVSDDQDFMDNRIYRSADGTLAISFNAQYSINSLRNNNLLQFFKID